jgi:predicted aspartyl protease
MPILNIQLGAETKQHDGKTLTTLPIPPQLVRGPIVQVTVGVGQQIATQVLQAGGTLPVPISGFALIDTGATTTCIDEDAAQQLQLPAIDVVTISSASHSSTQQNVYPIQIGVVGLPITVNAPRSIGAPLKGQGILVLIGRDVLQHCVLVYNGQAGSFTLAI